MEERFCNYIFKKNKMYYVINNPAVFRTDFANEKMMGKLPVFFTLDSAINEIRRKHNERKHKFYGLNCDCRKISRFTTCRNGKVEHEVWSLKELSAYFIKSYYFCDKLNLYKTLPESLREYVGAIRAPKRQIDSLQNLSIS